MNVSLPCTKRQYALRNLQNRSEWALNGYVFLDAEHARKWLSQKFVTDEDYAIVIQDVRLSKRCCPQCGYRSTVVLKSRTYTRTEFLAMQASSD
jgi:hypothetical protein